MDGGAWWAAVHGVTKSRTRLSDFTFTFHFHALEKEMATHSSILAWENPRDGGAWWAAVYGVAQSQTRLKQLSSRSSWSMLTLMLFLCNFHEIWYIKNKFIFLRTKCFFWSWVSQLPIHGRNFNDFLAYTANTSNKFIGYIITEQEHVQFLWNYRIYKPF